MPPAPSPAVSYTDRAPLRRFVSFLLAVLAEVLLLLMLLKLTPTGLHGPPGDHATVVELLPEPAHEKAAAKSAPPKPLTTTKAPPPVPPPIVPPLPNAPLQMMIVPHDVYAKSDISKLPSHPKPAATAGNSDQSASAGEGAAGDSRRVGTGPHGEPLYQAEWYREPTDAELAYYLPHDRPSLGWGMIACRTVENYRVEDCAELDDSPPGSGLARAVRQASWQFRVRPPRVGGKPLVGSWVRIRIDYKAVESK